ncbi:hypothetical protein JI721_11980 [Alicyclobacillus cycloheptanicus]|uniref:Uncharacterized protein n=1 Tax=Alicyclobacillus cycloheptanicus TaxID=1457 RepID=A0ABT9XG72_9BACL|nr:hypothetical protein [Alicyclobacillus cycloheptanicus]MDQ0189255.1 hypothetical protein [Alicyclobacillus cycloheptanicus]WDM00438.1 hypothetical protein JI721_11980 [Alicyclobacillus cycloheptanicus]
MDSLQNNRRPKRVRIVSLDDSIRRGLNCEGVKIGMIYNVGTAFEGVYRIVINQTKFWPSSRWVSVVDVEPVD